MDIHKLGIKSKTAVHRSASLFSHMQKAGFLMTRLILPSSPNAGTDSSEGDIVGI